MMTSEGDGGGGWGNNSHRADVPSSAAPQHHRAGKWEGSRVPARVPTQTRAGEAPRASAGNTTKSTSRTARAQHITHTRCANTGR
jgi:hypothetical protein